MRNFSQLALIALGSNRISQLGNAAETIQKAMISLDKLAQRDVEQSRLFQTPAFPTGSGPDFVNAAAAFFTDLPAVDLLAALHLIEFDAGRERGTRWGPRTLDLDLIALGDEVWPDKAAQTHWRDLPPDRQSQETPDTLILPHPRLQDRSFVLVPLMDVAPDWHHPLLDRSVAQMHDALAAADRATVVAIT